MTRRGLPLCLALLLLAGCAATASRSGTAMYRRDIGTASGGDAVSTGQRVINMFQYEIESVDTTPEIRIVTYWRKRPPLEDERGIGVNDAESRIVIMARQRGQTELGTFFSITMNVENRVRVGGSPDWNETLNTEMFRKYADQISNEYRQLIANIGVRKF